MRDIDQILGALQGQERFVLGTLVHLWGSGYRRPGARILIKKNGEFVGSISGGCLERDVARGAWEFIKDGPALVEFDTRSNEFFPAGKYGAGCEGILHILLQEFPSQISWNPVEIFQKNLDGFPMVIAHVWDGLHLGATAIFDGTEFREFGEFNFGNIRHHIEDFFREKESAFLELKVTNDRVFLEYLEAPVDLLIVGAGHDAKPVAQLAKTMGWSVRVASDDDVKLHDFRDVARTQSLTDGTLDGLDLRSSTSVVVMSHRLDFDAGILRSALQSPAGYVGVLGPRNRTRKIVELWRQQGWLPDKSMLERFQSPIGLDLGSETPHEVALSIISHVLAYRRNRSGGGLRQSPESIHRAIPRVVVE